MAVLLDRDAELSELGRRLAEARAGSGRVIVVEGPAGIGKSSLLAAVARGAAADGIRVLRAWGGPLEHDAACGIARQLFTPIAEQLYVTRRTVETHLTHVFQKLNLATRIELRDALRDSRGQDLGSGWSSTLSQLPSG